MTNSLAEDTKTLLREDFRNGGVLGTGVHERCHKISGTGYELCDEKVLTAHGPPS